MIPVHIPPAVMTPRAAKEAQLCSCALASRESPNRCSGHQSLEAVKLAFTFVAVPLKENREILERWKGWQTRNVKCVQSLRYKWHH